MAKKPNKITPADFKSLAKQVCSTLEARKKRRKDSGIERAWDEVDRQVAMIPAKMKYRKGWVPEFELPLQANALEVLCADADRMQFPDSHEWFNANGNMTDDLLERMSEDVQLAGVNDDLPGLSNIEQFDQEDVNAITEAAIIHINKQYPLRDHVNQLNAEAFKYGTYAGRVRMTKRSTFTNTFRGVNADHDEIPVLVPCPIRHTYLDDTPIQALYQGHVLRPTHMHCSSQRIGDLQQAASSGSSDTTKMDGGWITAQVKELDDGGKPDESIDIVEAEGDFIIKRDGKGKSMYFPNLIVTVAIDIFGEPTVIRIRENPLPFNSLIYGTYYKDKIGVYGISPLMKGVPIQTLATETATNLIEVSVLSARPPLAYNSNDPRFRATGGPEIEPNAQWDTFTNPDVIEIGNISDSTTAYGALVKQYEDVVGVNSLRSGGQTKSHQTARAVNLEDSRGQSRTVMFVRQQARGFITDVLNMKLFLLRMNMKRQDVYIPKYSGYLTFGKEAIPDSAHFAVTGSAGPLDKREAANTKISSLVSVLKLEPVARQLGAKPLDIDRVREDVLKEGMPDSDVQKYFKLDAPQNAPPPDPGVGANLGGVNPEGGMALAGGAI